MAAAGGTWSKRRVALPASWEHLLSSLPSTPIPLFPPHTLTVGWSMNGVTLVRCGGCGSGGGATPSQAWPRQLWARVGPPPPWRGRWGLPWRRGIGRVWGRRSRRALPGVCAGWGTPWRSRETSPAPTGSFRPPRQQPSFAGRKCNVLFVSKRKPLAPQLFWSWSGCVCVLGVGERRSFRSGQGLLILRDVCRGVSLQTRGLRSPGVPICGLGI